MKTFNQLLDDNDLEITEDENGNLGFKYTDEFLNWFKQDTGIENPTADDIGKWLNNAIKRGLQILDSQVLK